MSKCSFVTVVAISTKTQNRLTEKIRKQASECLLTIVDKANTRRGRTTNIFASWIDCLKLSTAKLMELLILKPTLRGRYLKEA